MNAETIEARERREIDEWWPVCSCGRPTVTRYHQHCATCIRHAKPA